MKKFTILMSFAVLAFSQAKSVEYTCLASKFRINGGDEGKSVNSRFVMVLSSDTGTEVAKSLIGHVDVSAFEQSPYDNYYSVFVLKDLASNPNYNGHKYTNHVQFKEINESASSSADGGGMNGYLVVNKDRKSGESFDAHYVFQSGDHIGGTIDYDCQ